MADKIKLFLAVAVIAAGIYGFYHFADQHQVLRVVGLIVVVAIAAGIALQTTVGRESWAFIQDSRTEVRKVVWPTRKETVQMTLTVMVMTVIMALILWGFDTLLSWLVRILIG
ncbi:MAG: preprotein translocase subunit SecE [Granulosicoccaceae bacterium]|jgi:preprotein translocase subunit SecE